MTYEIQGHGTTTNPLAILPIHDSECTRDLHAAASELAKIAGHASLAESANTREVFLHLRTIVQAIERVSQRVDRLEREHGRGPEARHMGSAS